MMIKVNFLISKTKFTIFLQIGIFKFPDNVDFGYRAASGCSARAICYVVTTIYKNIPDAIKLATDLTKCNLPQSSSIACVDSAVLSKSGLFSFRFVGIIMVKGTTANISKAPTSHNVVPPKYQTPHADIVETNASAACITDALL